MPENQMWVNLQLLIACCKGKTLRVLVKSPEKPSILIILQLIVLPGYGYAKVSQSEKDRWAKLMESYFASERIDLGILIVDARHAPTNNDITMAQWFIQSGCPFVVVANKLDKLKKSELLPNMQTIREDLELPEDCPVIPFSAEKGNGRDELIAHILAAVNK